MSAMFFGNLYDVESDQVIRRATKEELQKSLEADFLGIYEECTGQSVYVSDEDKEARADVITEIRKHNPLKAEEIEHDWKEAN